MSQTLTELNEVFQEVFDDDEITVERQTSAKDIEEWDSLMHVNLVLAVEKRFGVRFTSTEVASLQNVGELCDLIDRKRG
ncbi:MAG: acyl carrier protein [Phycisphaeraceae bacterium]